MWSCVSVPLRVDRPGPDVGKVAQCLSHDPRGFAIQLEHRRKCSEERSRFPAHPHMDLPAEPLMLCWAARLLGGSC